MRWCNVMGPVLGMVSALMLWKYGLPKDIRRDGASFLALEETDCSQIAAAAMYDRRSRGAIGLLFVSFLLQLAPAVHALLR